jgi:hypothetical protein
MPIFPHFASWPTGKSDEIQFSITLVDPLHPGPQSLWITHPIPSRAKTKVFAALLSILSEVANCAAFDQAQKKMAELWLQHHLDQPTT